MQQESLIGSAMGPCLLTQVIAQAQEYLVFQALQAQPRRQVAVKVLFPPSQSNPSHLSSFLSRFRRVAQTWSTLSHPNIFPLYEYGQQDGLAYLVMPLIEGTTLGEIFHQRAALSFSSTGHYLGQLCEALDAIHASGIAHADLVPGNIWITPEERVLVNDIGVASVLAEGQTDLGRLLAGGAGGSPEYMAPEQFQEGYTDRRTDLYSLGVILYRMVTGSLPFTGTTAIHLRLQHLHIPPRAPHQLRPDISAPLERVLLRALAKKPADRYASGYELAVAYRKAIDVSLRTTPVSSSPTPSLPPLVPAEGAGETSALQEESITEHGNVPLSAPTHGMLRLPTRETSGATYQGRVQENLPTGTDETHSSQIPAHTTLQSVDDWVSHATDALERGQTGPVSADLPPVPDLGPQAVSTAALERDTTSPHQGRTTGALNLADQSRMIQFPQAGHPGEVLLGLISRASLSKLSLRPPLLRRRVRRPLFWGSCLLLALLLVGGSLFWTASRTGRAPGTSRGVGSGYSAANILLSDPLDHNTNNWPVVPSSEYRFTGGAYHVSNQGGAGLGVVMLDSMFSDPISYSLTTHEVAGNDTSRENTFGLMLRCNYQSEGGNMMAFYSFEVANTPGGDYRFLKYDARAGHLGSAWTLLWHQPFGGEFREGHGPGSTNTLTVVARGTDFTLRVNGVTVGTVRDGTFASGSIGMQVNLKGTEVAFSHLVVARA